LNAHVLDFFHHGTREVLTRDNGIPEREVFGLLNDFLLTMKTIETSLKEMFEGESSMTDADALLLKAIKAVNDRFGEQFEKAFGVDTKKGRHNQKGCIAIHNSSCFACSVMEDATKVYRRDNGTPFSIRGKHLTCETPMVLALINCSNCRKQYVKKCVEPVSKAQQFGDQESGTLLDGTKHANHTVTLLILEKCDNLEKLDRAAIEWKERLKAEYLN